MAFCRLLFLSIFIISASTVQLLGQQDLDLYGPVAFGKHTVGFQQKVVVDRSQTFVLAESQSQPPGRPLHLAIWYPASAPSNPMTYADYVALLGSTIPSQPQNMAWSKQQFRKSMGNLDGHLSEDQFDAFMNTRVKAFRDAPKAPGLFPTVLYYAGGAVHPNATFCEYLASHGYVVVSLQALGTYTRRSRGSDPHRYRVMLRDLEFRMSYVSEHWPQADPARIAVVAFSFSATVAVLAAIKHPRIKAVVALDPYEMYVQGRDAFDVSPYFHAPDFQIPLLSLFGDQRWQQLKDDFQNHLPYADRTIILIDDFRHVDFLTTGRCYKEGRTSKRIARMAAANAAMRVFLDAQFGRKSRDQLQKALAKQDPGKAFTITHTPGKPAAAHSANFAATLAQGEDLATIREQLSKAKAPTHQKPFYREEFMNWMASQALRDERLDLAFLLYGWVTEAYPDSAAAHTGMGNVHVAKNQKSQAIAAFKRALVINPNYRWAKRGLERINQP